MKTYLTEYVDLKTGKLMGGEIEAETWEDAEDLTKIGEKVIGELISDVEISSN